MAANFPKVWRGPEILAIVVVLTAWTAWPHSVRGQDMVQIDQAIGLGSYYSDDAGRSREEALEAAFRDAVEQASGIFVTAETEVRNWELVRDDMLTRSQGFIRQYDVMAEGPEGNLYKIVIQALVERAAFVSDMNASLELIYQRVGKPRVVVVLTEENDPLGENSASSSTASLHVADKEIRKILLKQGFKFIDARAIMGGDLLKAAVTGGYIRRDSAVDIARAAEAEIVILGRAVTKLKGKISRFYSVQAILSLDVVRVDNGQVLASESVISDPHVDLDAKTAGLKALKSAAATMTPKMMEQVTYLWVKERNEGTRIEVLVENISFGDLLAFRRALGNTVRGVKQVSQRSYSDGVALLEVLSRGNTDKLAEALYETEFEKFRLEIQNVSANRVTLNVVVR